MAGAGLFAVGAAADAVLVDILGLKLQAALGGPMAANQRLGTMFVNMLPVEGTQPEDVSDTVVFLASDESKMITAHEIAPDAGVTEM